MVAVLALATGQSQQRNCLSCQHDLSGRHLWTAGPGPALVLNALNSLNPGGPSTVGKGKPGKLRPSLWAVLGGVVRCPHCSCWGSSAGAWRGWKGLHVCTNSPWIGEGLTARAWPRHRVTRGRCQLEGWGSPLLVVCGSKGEPLASAPVGQHVSRPYVKGRAV